MKIDVGVSSLRCCAVGGCLTADDKDSLSVKKHFTCLQKAARPAHPPEMNKSMLFSLHFPGLEQRLIVRRIVRGTWSEQKKEAAGRRMSAEFGASAVSGVSSEK